MCVYVGVLVPTNAQLSLRPGWWLMAHGNAASSISEYRRKAGVEGNLPKSHKVSHFSSADKFRLHPGCAHQKLFPSQCVNRMPSFCTPACQNTRQLKSPITEAPFCAVRLGSLYSHRTCVTKRFTQFHSTTINFIEL